MKHLTPAFLLLCLASLPAAAATYVVTSTVDDVNANPGDGVCLALNPANGCTLRAAIQEANASPTHDTIILDFGVTYTLSLTGPGEDQAASGDLDIHNSVTIATPVVSYELGSRPTIAAHPTDRIFDIHNAPSFTLAGVNLANGVASNVDGDEHRGGAIQVRNGATANMQIEAVRFINNRAVQGGGIHVGRNNNVHIIDSEFVANSALASGNLARGSAIHSHGRVTLERSAVFLNDSATSVAAVHALPGNFNDVMEMILINSTVADNAGRGISFGAQTTDHALRMRNSSVIGNGDMGLSLVLNSAGAWSMRNTVLAGNGGQGDCNTFYNDLAMVSLNRYNADSDNTCGLAEGSSNYPGIDPLLAPLARRMGDFVHAVWPLPGSPLVDKGHPLIGPLGCEAEDQARRTRPANFSAIAEARCDVGAVELPEDLIFFDPLERVPMN